MILADSSEVQVATYFFHLASAAEGMLWEEPPNGGSDASPRQMVSELDRMRGHPTGVCWRTARCVGKQQITPGVRNILACVECVRVGKSLENFLLSQ